MDGGLTQFTELNAKEYGDEDEESENEEDKETPFIFFEKKEQKTPSHEASPPLNVEISSSEMTEEKKSELYPDGNLDLKSGALQIISAQKISNEKDL